jgi:hypothetical protein
MSKAQEVLENLDPKDRAKLTKALRGWSKGGVERPLIPMADDVTEDGIADAWGLDEHGELVVVAGIPLADTVYKTEAPS